MQHFGRDSTAAHEGDGLRATPTLITTLALLAGYTAPAMIYDALPPILPRVAAHFGGGREGEWIAQMSVALAILGTGFGGVVAGSAIGRIGLRAALICGWLLFALSGSIGLIVDESGSLLVSRFATGLGAGILLGGSTIGIALSYSASARPRVTGFGLATAAGSAVAFLYVAAMVAEVFWRAPFALHMILALIVIPLVVFARFPAVEQAASLNGREFVSALGRLYPTYALILVLVLVGNLFIVQTTFLLSARGFSEPGFIARILVVAPIVIGIANLCFGWVEERIGIGNCVASALGFFALGAFCYGASPWLPITTLGVALGSIGVGIGVPAAFVSVMNRCDEKFAPQGVGLATAINCFAGFLAPTIYVPLYHRFGYDATYLAISALMAVSAVLYVMASRARGAVPVRPRA